MQPSLTPRQVLEATKAYLRQHPEKYNQDGIDPDDGCIAALMCDAVEIVDGASRMLRAYHAMNPATKYNNIWLFASMNCDCDCWPADLVQAYQQAPDAVARVEVACQAIDRYMEEQKL